METDQGYTIIGSEVSLAAELMSAAHWGEIWVSHYAFDRLEPFGKFESVGTLLVKGKQETFLAYRLESMEESPRLDLPFVNREQEYEVLQGCLGQLLYDRMQGQIILLTGEPGIGKSRLWTELRPIAEAYGILWLTGHCDRQGATYHLLADIIRNYLQLEAENNSETQQRVLAQNVERLFGPDFADEKEAFLAIVMGLPLTDKWKDLVGSLFPEYKHPDSLSVPRHQEPKDRLSARLAQETATFLERLAEDQPLILSRSQKVLSTFSPGGILWQKLSATYLVCENLHWLDSGSSEVLLKVMELVEHVPIMLGLTLRPNQNPVCDCIAGAARSRFMYRLQDVSLGPLNAKHSAEIVSVISDQAIPPVQQEDIHRRGGGNPLFVIEITHYALIAPGVTIPDTIETIIESRVGGLPERSRRTIRAAAVVGNQFSLPELVCMLREQEKDVRRDLAALLRMELVNL